MGATPGFWFERPLKQARVYMNFGTLIRAMALFWLLASSLPSPSSPALANEGHFLADKHKNKGADCSGCHKESPPKQDVPMAICLGCHGDYGKVALKTDKLDPNPHDSHLGEIDCGKCHHAHKASVNFCNPCHELDMKVP
jgi:Cytochrome c3